MTDPLDTIQKRLGWINRGLIAGAIVLVLLLIAYTWHRLHAGSAPPQPAAPASRPIAAASHPSVAASHPLAAASPAAATSQPAAAPASAAAASAPAVAAASQPVATASAAASPSASASAAAAVQPQAQPVAPAPRTAAAQAAHRAAAAHRAPPRRAAEARAPRHAAPRHAARRTLPAAGAVCHRAGWYVQVGAFSEAAGYRRLQQRLAHFGLPTCRGPRKPRGLHELLVGPYASRAEAERLRSHLKAPLRKASFLRHLR